MIGLDTNILVRYIVQDDPRQAASASRVIAAGAREGETFFIAHIVLCELVWVLEDVYGYGRQAIAPVLEAILATRQFAFEGKDLLWQALADYREGKADFADYLIGRIGLTAGCEKIFTFDRALVATPPFAAPA